MIQPIEKIELFDCAPEEILDVLAEFNRTFVADRSLSQWKWKFSIPGFISRTLKATSGEVIGHYGVVFTSISIGGKSVKGGQLVDLFVSPKSTVRGFIGAVSNDLDYCCKREGIELLFTFPNGNSFFGLVRAGFSHIAFMQGYFRRLAIRKEIFRRVRSHLLADILNGLFRLFLKVDIGIARILLENHVPRTLVHKTTVLTPENYDAFWKEIKKNGANFVCKDLSYLKWRYDESSENDYRYFYIEKDSKIVALSIVREKGDEVIIAEFQVLGFNPFIGKSLLNSIERFYLGAKKQRVSWACLDSEFFKDAFCNYKRLDLSTSPFLIKIVGNHHRFDRNIFSAKSWEIVVGDGDSV